MSTLALRGSEKQIAWAEKIRPAKLAACRKALREWREYRERMRSRWPEEKLLRDTEAYDAAIAIYEALEREDRSWFFIDRRTFTAAELLAGKEPPPSEFRREGE